MINGGNFINSKRWVKEHKGVLHKKDKEKEKMEIDLLIQLIDWLTKSSKTSINVIDNQATHFPLHMPKSK